MIANTDEPAAATSSPFVVPEAAADEAAEAGAATTELRNFGSDHAVDGRHPDAAPVGAVEEETRRLESLTIGRAVARRRASRPRSITVGDLAAGLSRPASSMNDSLMSSLTLTDYGGDSFFTDEDSWWLLDALLEEHEDQQPICPMRRDSMSEERLTSSRHYAFHDLGMPHTHDGNDNDNALASCHPSKVRHDLLPKTARPPMKPGRRESAASKQRLRPNIQATKDSPIVPPYRKLSLSLSTFSGYSGDSTIGSGSAAASAGGETTSSSTISPTVVWI